MERRPKTDLTGKQRKQLRGLAHTLTPLVRIGQRGLSVALGDAVFEALEEHELIKVKILQNSSCEKKEAAEWMADRCGAHVAGVVGRIVILYRRHKDKPQIELV